VGDQITLQLNTKTYKAEVRERHDHYRELEEKGIGKPS
jgi:hypothetical protein